MKTLKSNLQKFKNQFKAVDILGSNMQFTINGEDTYKSNLGAWVTIIIYSIVLVYAANKSIKLSERLDTSYY